MNGPQHYLEAERMTEAAREEWVPDGLDRSVVSWDTNLLMVAKVHALLAVAASNVATDREQFDAWREVTG